MSQLENSVLFLLGFMKFEKDVDVLFTFYESQQLQLNKHENAPYFFLLKQNLTSDCLLISVFLPKFD